MTGSAGDLTGTLIGEWVVEAKAPAQNRVRMWTVIHGPCGTTVDVAQTLVSAAAKGKGSIPACLFCAVENGEAAPDISHGMHLACGAAHLVGTACVDPVLALALEAIDEEPPTLELADLGDPEVAEWLLDRGDGPEDVLDVIRAAMQGHPRSAQWAVGPSELGGCERRLGHRVAFGRDPKRGDDAWRPQVGTAVHAWLSDAFAATAGAPGDELDARWIADFRVESPVAGTLDLYDARRAVVIDFKVVGTTTLKKAAKGQISTKYETQLDLYGAGLIEAGFPVETVALLFLPSAGVLTDAVWYERPFNFERAAAAVSRLRKVEALLKVADPAKVLAILSIEEDYCGSCPALGKFCDGAAPAAKPALTIEGAA